ncbi:phosphatase PAP2 family protein [Glutamicibacter protophormiae]|uniref:phosphatase PAP2 family protein n=1 Tax=Glutamicibacter protophormiae TaxID=37930 RepID=UPI003A941C37
MTTTRPAARHSILVTGFTGLIVVIAVWIAGLSIAATPSWSHTEVRVVAWVGSLHNPFLNGLTQTIDVVIGPFIAPLLGILLMVAGLVITGTWRGALRAGVLLAVPWGIAEVLKYAVQRPRPDLGALSTTIAPDTFTFSFPSGHAAFAAALVCAIILCLSAPRTRARAVVIVIGAVFVLVIAWSRVYLGVHYPTDVIASMIVVPAVAIPLDRITRRMSFFGPQRR